MIPVRLTLKNFMSYGDEATTLPFDGLHVACLSGDNGNGKSALLDAMTWSLWGKTRASSVKSVSEDDLIRVGAEEMEVRFEFELNDNFYRVVRKRRRGKTSGTSDWQLAQADASGGWLPIGGGSQRETAKQVVQLLSMEYETFLNSAYLQQGRADEFTRQTPDKRKGILAEILNLQRFDRLEEKAKAQLRERKEVAIELDREIQLLEAETARLPGYEEDLAQTQAALTEVETRAAEEEKQQNDLRARFHKLETVAEHAAAAEERWRKAETEIALLKRDLEDKCFKLADMQEVLEQKAAIVRDYRAYEEAEKKRDSLEPQLREYEAADRELRTVIGEIEKEKTRLEGEIRLQESRLRTLETNAARAADLEKQIAAGKQILQNEAELARQWETAAAEQERLREEFADLRAKNNEFAAAVDEVEEVLEMLARPHAVCPVCESDLSGTKHQRVLQRQEEKKAKLLAEQEQVKLDGRTRKQELTVAEEQVKKLQMRREEQAKQHTRIQELSKQRDSFAGVEAELAEVQKHTAALRRQLERDEYAAPKRIQKQRLEQERERLKKISAEYEAARQRVMQLKHIQERYQQLLAYECDLEQEVKAKERLEAQVGARQKESADERKQWEKLHAQLAQFDDLQQQVILAEDRYRRTQVELNRLRSESASLQTYIARCQQAETQRKDRAARRKILTEEGRVYTALVTAFGKSGIQTYIIENAIPEIEAEANELLAQITDNAMSLRFETTRKGKTTKSEIETLDIKIMDDAGRRPYELFSGGEGFRINFAIRIALSRLLARRSGAKLQTLILDEGFGSQDGKGRERLVEVIEAIKDDFAKILVITHFEEMKDAFPQRIEIIKDANGSRIHVL